MTSYVHVMTHSGTGIVHAIEFDEATGAVSLFTSSGVAEYNQQEGVALAGWQHRLQAVVETFALVGAFVAWINNEVGDGPETVITEGPPLEWFLTDTCRVAGTDSALVVVEGNP
jgi:hypothetical protein